MSESDKSAGWAAYYEKLRERPPRKTVLNALDRFEAAPAGRLAVDLGCGDGRDAIEMLRRGWRVMAIDAEPLALERLQERPDLPPEAALTPLVARMEHVSLPNDALLINSSFAMPLCAPADFHRLWAEIRLRLPRGGRFSGQWYGERDSWNGREGITFVSRKQAFALLDGLDVEYFDEEEHDGVTPRGNAKHWHIFHIVARKP